GFVGVRSFCHVDYGSGRTGHFGARWHIRACSGTRGERATSRTNRRVEKSAAVLIVGDTRRGVGGVVVYKAPSVTFVERRRPRRGRRAASMPFVIAASPRPRRGRRPYRRKRAPSRHCSGLQNRPSRPQYRRGFSGRFSEF